MAMAELDIDAILEAQDSDGEQNDEAAEGEEILDAEAFDRRLEEILNAEEDEEEDDDNEVTSSSANSPSDHLLDRFSGETSAQQSRDAELSESSSLYHTFSRDARASESASHDRTPSREAPGLGSPLYPTSSGDVTPSHRPLQFDASVKDVKVFASSPLFRNANTEALGLLQPRISSKDDESSPQFNMGFRRVPGSIDNARNLSAQHEEENSSQSQSDARASDALNFTNAYTIAAEELLSRSLPSLASHPSTTPGRQSGSFSPDMFQSRADYGTDAGQYSPLSSLSPFSGKTGAPTRLGAALTAAAAPSSQASTPLDSKTTFKRLPYQDEPFIKDGSTGDTNLSSSMVLNVYHVGDVEADVTSLVSELVDNTDESNRTKREDDTLLLEEKLEVFTNGDDDDDDDDEDDDSNDGSPLANDVDVLSTTDDDSDREEIQSFLSKELMASDVKGRPLGEDNLQNAPRLTKSTSNVTEAQYSALEKAEETEKKAAFSGFHIEEGAASQPKRLKGIQTGPPTIGHVHLDSIYSVSQILSLPSTMRDHGTGQAITTHTNYLAVGLSKGNVLLLSMKNSGMKFADAIDTKPIFLSSADKSHASVTSMSFNMQGDLLLVGHANGFLALWELSPRGGSSKPVNVEHNAAILHTAFLCTKYQKAITADCKGLVLLHSISWGTFGRYSVTTQCLVDGQNTGMVLSLSPLLLDVGFENSGNSSVLQPSTTAAASTALTSMVGGMVRGVVAGKSPDLGKKTIHEGGTADEAGNMVVFVTHQSIIVFRLPPMLEKCAMLPRPDGIRDGAIPYIAWRRLRMSTGVPSSGSSSSRNQEPVVEMDQHSEEEGEKENHPLLVLGWDKKVFILQLLKGAMKILVNWDLDSVICGATWLDEQIVAIVTLKEQLCLFTNKGVEVQRLTMESDDTKKSLDLSYHTHLLNTFGNPEKTFYSSLAVRAATMYLLGSQQIYRARLLPWHDQLKALQDAGDWMGAFHVGMELFDGRALSVMGLPRELDPLQKVVTPTLLDLLSAYIDEVFTYLSLAFGTTIEAAANAEDKEELMAQAKEQYARVGGVAIEFCVHIHQTEVLFDNIFHKFCTAGQRGTFLELLEPYILNDTLGALAPEVMQGLVEYYSQMGWVQRVELCVLHMDIASLDFNQVVRLCRENGLYSALIYLFNRGLDDYKSPLEELLIVVQDVSKPNAQACGYKLLIYLKYCFMGLAFPPGRGEIPASRLPVLRSELVQCLLDNKTLNPPHTAEKLVDFQSIIHPRLSCLLSFDLLATLEVLQYAFPENGPLGIGEECLKQRLPSTEKLDHINEAKDGLRLLQDVVGALTDILERIHLYNMEGNKHHVEVDGWRLHMSKIDAGHIMEFIAEYVASGRAKVTRVVLARIFEYLTSADKKAKKLEDKRRKEGLLVKLLNGVPEADWDPTRMLELVLQAQFWQASACLLAKKGDLVAALDSFMKDKEQPYNGFLFILDVLNPEKQSTKEVITEFRSSVLVRLPQLLQLSSEATLVIMLKHFSKEHRAILSDLAPYPPLLFQYLKQIMNARLGYKASTTLARTATELSANGKNAVEPDLGNKNSDFVIGNESLSDLLKNAGLEFSNEMEELYVELLCKFEPNSVLKFLKSFEDYRLEHCLKLCQEHGVTDAAAYLLERVGDIGSALSLVLADSEHHIHKMDLSVARLFAQQANIGLEVQDNAEQFLSIPEVASTCFMMQAAIELCQRNTWRINPGESEALWFRLLDRFVEPLRKLHEARKLLRKKRASKATGTVLPESNVKESGVGAHKWKVVMISRRATDFMQRVLVYLIGEIVNGMMGYVPLSIIMDKLLSNNGKHEFGDFKGTILQMLGLYGYEQTILFTAKHVVEDDMFHNLSMYKRRASRGYAPRNSTCCVCKRKLSGRDAPADGRVRDKKPSILASHSTSSTGTNPVMIFFCGHAAHSSCIFPDVGVTKLKQDFMSCPCCPPKICLSKLPSGTRTRHKLL